MKHIIPRAILLIGLATALTACIGPGYYVQSLKGHVEIMTARKDVGKLIEDPSTPEALRVRMAAARDVRRFASDELALPDNASYRSFVDVGREYVTWAVFAAPEFSLAPQVWCFPVFGCVPYRGYFAKKSADELAQELEHRGLDVHVTGITAYSTLGWTSDPLLSTMFLRDKTYLASLVFHELAHQRVYVNDDTAFNEAFAVAVEMTGVRKWLRSIGDSDGLRRYEAGLKRSDDFVALVAQARDELSQVYGMAGPVEDQRAAKVAAIERLRARYRATRDRDWDGYGAYDAWFESPINNAKLAATSVYSDQVPAFLRLFELCAGDYPRFYEAVRRIGAVDKAGRTAALKAAETCV